jgi:transposase
LALKSGLGRPAKSTYRQITNALFYVLRGHALADVTAWRLSAPESKLRMTTVQHYFYAWRDCGLWQTLNHFLLMEIREACGKEASPTAGVIDSQSVKTTDPQGRAAQVASLQQIIRRLARLCKE